MSQRVAIPPSRTLTVATRDGFVVPRVIADAGVQAEGTSTRRHTIGLMPSNHTLTCTIAFASVADGARFSVGRGCFGRRVIQIDYCHTSRSS